MKLDKLKKLKEKIPGLTDDDLIRIHKDLVMRVSSPSSGDQVQEITRQDLLKHLTPSKGEIEHIPRFSPWLLPDGCAFKPSRDDLSEVEELKEVMVHWEKYEEELVEVDGDN